MLGAQNNKTRKCEVSHDTQVWVVIYATQLF